ARVDARPRLLSELAHAARPPETSQSQADHGCGTFFVAVADGEPDTHRTRSTPAIPARRRYAAFSTAPVGITPSVAYRHSAISSFRASATMPILRVRLPRPKRSWYQRVRALWRCHWSHPHASCTITAC